MIHPETPLTEKASSLPLETGSNGLHHSQDLQDEQTMKHSINLSPEENKIDLETFNENKQKTPQSSSQIHPFTFTKANSLIFFKKIKNLSKPKDRIGLVCYVPERNLLLVLLSDCMTLNIYSTITFKPLAIRKSQGMILCMSYSPRLQKILIGGYNSLLQIWCPKALKIEKESPKIRYPNFYNIEYIPDSNVIVTKSSNEICVYDTELVLLKDYPLPIYGEERASAAAEFHSLSKEILFVTSRFRKRKRLYLLNLRKKTLEECTQIFVPRASCVELIEDDPTKVFSCLVADEADVVKLSQIDEESYPFTLALFAISPETGGFTVFKKTSHTFSKLHRVENSQYFLAQKPTHEMFLLSIKKENVESISVISCPSPMILDRYCIFVMIKGGPFLVEKTCKGVLSVSRCHLTIQSEKNWR